MRTSGNVALAAALAGAMLGCAGPESTESALACDFTVGPRGDGMPDLEMQVGDTVRVPLRDHFGPVECLELWEYHEGDLAGAFETGSSDPAAVAVSTSVNDLKTVAIGVADSVRVTVRQNSYFLDDEPHEFLVRVRPAGL